MGGYAQMMAGIPRSMPGNQENAPARMVTSYVFFTSFRLVRNCESNLFFL